ncbi:monooxygenase [Agyrium rufum]|nr:monooxygenase [Agyrium rufum]
MGDVLIIGAGFHGLATAKVLLHDEDCAFQFVTIFEKNSSLGGVWASTNIYDGLTTYSPSLTYELPDFPYSANLRRAGVHVPAQDVNKYLHDYVKRFGVHPRIHYNTCVEDVSWNTKVRKWDVRYTKHDQKSSSQFDSVVICVGLYHTPHNPLTDDSRSSFAGNIYHSSDIGNTQVRKALLDSANVSVIGAGKSALDVATLIAKGAWAEKEANGPQVTLVYRRPHWISPRKIIRRHIPFEQLLFSRFVNAHLPYATFPDSFHRLIAESPLARWLTNTIVRVVKDDFIKSNHQQDLPHTIPDHALSQALSGALHVEPPGYLDCLRSGRIRIIEGSIRSLQDTTLTVNTNNGGPSKFSAESIVLATGYRLALPFLLEILCKSMGMLKQDEKVSSLCDLPYFDCTG